MELKYDKIQTTWYRYPVKIVKRDILQRIMPTSNYYFDLTTVKSRLSEAGELPRHSYICICTI